jgi:hypothetical protein
VLLLLLLLLLLLTNTQHPGRMLKGCLALLPLLLLLLLAGIRVCCQAADTASQRRAALLWGCQD